MARHLPALAFVLYLGADLANPLMPGALTFDPTDSVDAVHAERAWAPPSRAAADAGPRPPA
jgi:hypothetical protein